MPIEIKNYDFFNFLAGRGKMTSGNTIFIMMMLNKNNRVPLVWIDSVILIFKYKLQLLDANSSFFMGFDCLLMACEDRKVTGQDLRVKLQKKGLQPATRSGKSSTPSTRDLRERLSGTMNTQPKNSDPPKSKVIAKPSSKSVGAEAPAVKRPANPAPKKARKVILS